MAYFNYFMNFFKFSLLFFFLFCVSGKQVVLILINATQIK